MAEIPATIGGKYSVVRCIGKGGMGSVYEALDPAGQRVALKVIAEELSANEAQRARFEREARTVALLDTPHVAKVFDAGIDPGTKLPFMAMEYLEGEDLRQLLRRVGQLAPAAALKIAVQACAALAKAHEAHVLHRDIKPANLFLARDGDRRIVKLLDFGVAKTPMGLRRDAEVTNLTQTGGMIGSPLYMSPEQAQGSRRLDERADIWSLGVVLYQMLSGRTPHTAIEEVGQLIVLICTYPPSSIQERSPWVSKQTAAVVHRALRMTPDERFASAAAMGEALAALLPDGTAIQASDLRKPSEDERAHVAEKVPPEILKDGPAPLNLDSLSDANMSSSRSDAGPPPASRWSGAWRVAALGLAAVGMAGAAYTIWRPESPPAPPQPAPAEAPEPVRKTMRLAIAPSDARVNIDGTDVAVENGTVQVTGEAGSVHAVLLTVGDATQAYQVVIAETGLIPAKVELAAPSSSASASSAPSASATATATASATARAPLTPYRPSQPPPSAASSASPVFRPNR